MSAPVIRLRKCARWYGYVLGLHQSDLEIGRGITGLVGPNGAGKSTLLKLVGGLIKPSHGSIEVLGGDPFGAPEILGRLGWCPSGDTFYEDMSARRFLGYVLRLQGYPRAEADQRGMRAVERVGLADAAERPVKGYSKGMRQRVKLAQAIAHDPKLIIADEPLNGLDPVARRFVFELFMELREEGVDLVISSHVLHELEAIVDSVVLIHQGHMLAQGSVSEMRRLMIQQPRRVHVRARRARELASAMMSDENVLATRVEGEDIEIETRDLESFLTHLPATVKATNAGVKFLESPDGGLEAVFDYMVGPGR